MYTFKTKKPFKYAGAVYTRGDKFTIKVISDVVLELIEFYFIAPINKSAKEFVDEAKVNFGKCKEIKDGKTLLHGNTNKK